jgi:hypothetical protein
LWDQVGSRLMAGRGALMVMGRWNGRMEQHVGGFSWGRWRLCWFPRMYLGPDIICEIPDVYADSSCSPNITQSYTTVWKVTNHFRNGGYLGCLCICLPRHYANTARTSYDRWEPENYG